MKDKELLTRTIFKEFNNLGLFIINANKEYFNEKIISESIIEASLAFTGKIIKSSCKYCDDKEEFIENCIEVLHKYIKGEV